MQRTLAGRRSRRMLAEMIPTWGQGSHFVPQFQLRGALPPLAWGVSFCAPSGAFVSQLPAPPQVAWDLDVNEAMA